MLQGILDKLTDFDDVQTKVLLDNYVFKIIPLLNPDGLARGNWRFDIKG
jgi:murein tripeptide amidase MpaA